MSRLPQECDPPDPYGGCCRRLRFRYLLLDHSGVLEMNMQALGTLAFGLMALVNLAVLGMLVAGIFRGTLGRH